MKHKKITFSGIIIAILSYAIICTYWPQAAMPLIIAPKATVIIIRLSLIAAAVYVVFKMISTKNKE